jgi:replicative DNA helicase
MLQTKELERYLMAAASQYNHLAEALITKSEASWYSLPFYAHMITEMRNMLTAGETVDWFLAAQRCANKTQAYSIEDIFTSVEDIHSHLSFDSYLVEFTDIATRNKLLTETTKLNNNIQDMTAIEYTTKLAKLSNIAAPATQIADKRHLLSRLTDPSIETKYTSYGISGLDEMCGGGGAAGDLIILAGRPGMGKTALALSILLKSAKKGNRILIASLEMSAEQLLLRLLSQKTNFPYTMLRRKAYDVSRYDYVTRMQEELLTMPFDIIDTPGLTVQELRQITKAHKPDLLMLDYLQLLTPEDKKASRNDQVGGMSRGLKLIAKENHIPVIALSQLSRDQEKRATGAVPPLPRLSDLRDSGSIEQDADGVWFVHRDSYYTKAKDEVQDAILHVAKQRNGETGDVPLQFNARCMRFG